MITQNWNILNMLNSHWGWNSAIIVFKCYNLWLRMFNTKDLSLCWQLSLSVSVLSDWKAPWTNSNYILNDMYIINVRIKVTTMYSVIKLKCHMYRLWLQSDCDCLCQWHWCVQKININIHDLLFTKEKYTADPPCSQVCASQFRSFAEELLW